MQSKDFIRAMLWAGVVFFAWQMIAVRIWPPVPPVDVGGPVASDPSTGAPTVADGSDRDATGMVASESVSGDGFDVVSGEPQTLTIGDLSGPASGGGNLRATLTTVGAAVVHADLGDYNLTIKEDSPPYPVMSEAVATDGSILHSFRTEQIHLRNFGATIALGDVSWVVESNTANEVVFIATIRKGGTPLLNLRKIYSIPPLSPTPPESLRHDLVVTYDFENLSDQRIDAILSYGGPVGLRQEDLRFNDRVLFSGIVSDDTVLATSYTMSPDSEAIYQRRDGDPLLWTAAANKYFVVFSAPRPGPGRTSPEWIAEVRTLAFATDKRGGAIATTHTATEPLPIEAGGRARFVIDNYVGPKKREAFQTVEDYAKLAYDEQVVSSYSMGPCSFMTPKSLTRFMIWMLNNLKAVVHNYGIAIIMLVLVVRTILHPVTKKGQVNMMRMQQRMGTLAPKMEEIKKKYANDKQKQSQETMKLYQDEGVNPMTGMMSSCLPMMLQMPIWIALFTSLNFNIDMRHQPFFWWINDLTAPDALYSFGREIHIPLISSMTGPITSFNLLPILVSLSMFAQQKLMPKPPAPATQSDEQAAQSAQMQKMMPYMTLVFGVFFYNMPSGLNLYIGTSSFFGMIEQKRIRAHIAELKEKGPPPPKTAKPRKNKGPSFFERLQKAAEEAQKAQPQSQKKRAR